MDFQALYKGGYLLAPSFYSWENWGRKKLTNLNLIMQQSQEICTELNFLISNSQSWC